MNHSRKVFLETFIELCKIYPKDYVKLKHKLSEEDFEKNINQCFMLGIINTNERNFILSGNYIEKKSVDIPYSINEDDYHLKKSKHTFITKNGILRFDGTQPLKKEKTKLQIIIEEYKKHNLHKKKKQYA